MVPGVRPPSNYVLDPVDGFRNAEFRAWYRNYFRNRPVLIEGRVRWRELPADVKPLIEERGWENCFANRSACNFNLVREFYASLRDLGLDRFQAYVRGTEVYVTPTTVADLLGAPEDVNAHCPWPSSDWTPSLDDIRSIITVDGTPPHPRLIYQKDLRPLYRKLNIYARSTFMRNDHHADFGHLHASYLMALGDPSYTFDLPRLALSFIRMASRSHSQRWSLTFGGLITAICEDANVEWREDDRVETSDAVVARGSFTKSGTAVARGVHGAGPSAEPADPAEEEVPEEDEPIRSMMHPRDLVGLTCRRALMRFGTGWPGGAPGGGVPV